MEKELQITGCKDGTASNGNNYTTFKTNVGGITIFDQKLVKQLKQVQHDEIAVCEVEENPKGDKIYYNITKLIELKHNDNFKVTTEKVNPITADSSKNTDKNCELMTAKDIFIKLLDEGIDVTEAPPDKGIRHFNLETIQSVMKQAIELVKQAREGLQ